MSDPLSILEGVVAAGAAALAVHAFFIEPTRVELTRHKLALPDLPPEWEGATVVHLTDLHYGDPRCDWLLKWAVKTTNSLDPDLIVITGDYVLSRPSEVGPCAKYLSQLRAKRGIVGTLGDHDFRKRTKAPIEGVCEQVRGAGVHLLRNESIVLEGGLRIAGIDPHTNKVENADIGAALSGLNGKPHFFLSHAPDSIHEIARHEVPLVLCGHTHGGQVVIPFVGPPITHSRVSRRFASGWSELHGTRMYTGRGLASHHSLRFWCRPEIAVFRLTSESRAKA